MCMQRKRDDDDGNRNRQEFFFPEPIMHLVDLTSDNDNDFVEVTSDDEFQWDNPYTLLPSSDEEEPVRGAIAFTNNRDLGFPASNTAHGSSNEINQNTNPPTTSTISGDNVTTHYERREFEMNIPQILLSMARITNHLHSQNSSSQD